MTRCPICDDPEYIWEFGCTECGYYDEDGHALRRDEWKRHEERMRKGKL